jgi:alginate O-acetyltransferase complex protein AlgJ
MPLDTHWSHCALRLAAHLIAERVRQYPWFQEVCPQPIRYQTKEVQTLRAGDLRGMLPDEEKLKVRPMTLTAQQVLKPDGSFYEDDPNSPIVLLGDSFCGVFHFEDCQHAGLSAHLARELGLPIDLIMAHGSGPRIRGQLARRGAEALRKKKLVLWTVVARDLYHYWAPWEKARVP